MKQLTYILKLIRYSFSTNRLLYVAVLMAIWSVVMELLAMNSLFPLATVAAGQSLGKTGLYVRTLGWLGLSPTLKVMIEVFIVLLMVRVATLLFSQGLSMRLAKRIQAQLSSQAFSVFVKDYRIQEIEKQSIGYFISLAGDEASRASTVILSLTQFVSQLCLALLYFAVIAYHSPAMGIAVVLFLATTFVCLFGIFRKSHELGFRKLEESRTASSVFLDALNGLRAVKAFSAEDYVTNSYRELIYRYTRTLFLSDFLSLFSRTVPVLILLGAFFGFIEWGSSVGKGAMNFAFWSTMIVFLLRFFPMIGQCLNMLLAIISEAKAGKNITDTIERKQAAQSHGHVITPPVDSIAVRHLDFSYDEHVKVLRDVSIKFEKGLSYAIIGPSGVGKSTLLDLLLKFYDVTEGDIVINDLSLKGVSESSLRSEIILLGQQTTIFNDTVMNNISFGINASPAEIERAARLAIIHETIMGLPEGYQTVLNYQGSNLSGGQRQRIGIARALLRGSDVLILDESTSALDTATRDSVLQNVLEDYRDRILIFVTHDPAIVGRVDRVIDLSTINRAARVTNA